MSHSDLIWILVTATMWSTLGVYVAVRKIKQYTRPIENTLVRRGDIELGDYIQHTNVRDIDLSSLPQYPQVIVNNPLPVRWENPPFYRSGTLPHYQSVDGININCCLENNINLEIILLIFIFLCFLILWRMRNNPWFKYFVEKFLMIQEVEIRILSIVLAIYLINKLIFYNSLYSISILIPFSFFEIDFRDSFEWKFDSYKVKPMISYIKLQNLTKDVNSLLLSLVDDVNYSMGLSFISSYKEWEKDQRENHPLLIEDAIIINKESDSLLISQFIMENLDKKGYFISDWLFKDHSLNTMDPVILIVTVPIKVKI